MIKTYAVLVALALALAGAPSMAQAASDTCSAARSDGFCYAGPVRANSAHHFVHINVNGPCNLFVVRDRANGLSVFQGSSGWSGYERTIGGLYSEYGVYLYGGVWPITYVTISN